MDSIFTGNIIFIDDVIPVREGWFFYIDKLGPGPLGTEELPVQEFAEIPVSYVFCISSGFFNRIQSSDGSADITHYLLPGSRLLPNETKKPKPAPYNVIINRKAEKVFFAFSALRLPLISQASGAA
jgi:hypothetical protein